MVNNSRSELGTWFSHTPPLLQLLAPVTLVFLLAFAADALLLRVVELFLAGIVEEDAFFFSAVRQQDALAQNILALIKLLSFLAIGVGFVVTLVFFFILFGRTSSEPPFRSEPGRLLRATLLSLRGIVTVTFMFLVVTAIYALLLRIIGNQPPFFLLAALVIAVMYFFILAYSLFDYIKELRAMPQEH